MDVVNELKKKLICESCQNPHSARSKVLSFHLCSHHACDSCMKGVVYKIGNHQCQVCGRSSFVDEISFIEDLEESLKKCESSITEKAESESDLREKIATFEQERAQLEASREDHIECYECGTSDSEKNMQLCTTCHGLKFDDQEDVKKNALCSTCAIRKHMRKGHQTIDFMVYLNAHNFTLHTPKIESDSEELKNARDILNNTFSCFNNLSLNVSESYDVLTDMARRSKNTKNQLEFIEKMQKFIDESKSIHVGADSELKERTKLLEENLAKIKEWYEARMENCVDESETIKLEKSEDSHNNHSENVVADCSV